VPPARSIRVGARASIRNFAHQFLVVIPSATLAVGALFLRSPRQRGASNLLFPVLETFRKM
jgi:hypothetical protein